MELFENSNYYKLLDVRANVSQFQIRRAYRKVLEIYRHESLVSYSLFSDGRRKQVLAKLEDAFTTLIDRDSRYRYDMQLVQNGLLKRDELSVESKTLVVARDRDERAENIKSATTLLKYLGKNAIAPSLVSGILGKDTIAGRDLKRIREDSDVSLKDMAAHTKVRVALLSAIENDEYDKLPSRFHLRSFLRTYVNCFVEDTDIITRISRRYLKRIDN